MKATIILLYFTCTTSVLGQVLVGDNGYKQVETSVAVHPNNSNIMATTVIELIPTGRQCLVYVSTNGGVVWTLRLSENDATDPVIEFDNNGNIFFCYLQRTESEIYIIKSTDLGATWALPVKISYAGSNNADKEWIAIDNSNNFIYLTWVESTATITQLMFSRSTNGGNLFSQPSVLYSSNNPIHIFSPFITTGNNGNVYLSFSLLKNFGYDNGSFDLGFIMSTNEGISFNSVVFIDVNNKNPGFCLGHNSDYPYVLKYEETYEYRAFRIYPISSMAVNNQNIYIVVSTKETKNYSPGLTSTDNSDLIVYKSTDNGLTWTKKRIYDYGTNIYKKDGDQFFPSIACTNNGHIYCLFYNSLIDGDQDNLYTKMSFAYSTNQAESFKIFDAEIDVFDPSIGSPAALRFNGEYIQLKAALDKIVMSYSKPLAYEHKLYFHSLNLTSNITVYNAVNSTTNLGDIFVDDIRHINLPQTLPLNLRHHSIESPNLVNEYKFYKWQSVLDPLNNSRIKKDNFIADKIKPVNSKFEITRPLSVLNYFEGDNGKTILFGEKNFDVTTRTSPHLENAFIYQSQVVEATYQATVSPYYISYLGTNWYFQNWENGSTNLVREEQISQNTAPEWRANYKGIQRSDQATAYANNSQRKFVRGYDYYGGGYFNIYESMDKVWLEWLDKSQGSNNTWVLLNNGQPLSDNFSKNPSIDYYESNDYNTYLFVVFQEKNNDNSYRIKLKMMDIFGTSITSEVFNEATELFETDANPVIVTGKAIDFVNPRLPMMVCWYKKESGGNRPAGLYIKFGYCYSSNVSISWLNPQPIHITGTTTSSLTPSLATQKYTSQYLDYIPFHLVYEDLHQIKYKKTIFDVKDDVFNQNNPLINISAGDGYSKNHKPSIIAVADTSSRICWVGERNNEIPSFTEYLEKTVVFTASDYLEHFWTFGDNVTSTSINKTNDKYAIAWASGDNNVLRFADNSTLKPVGTIDISGRDVQLCNGTTSNTMYALAFNTSGLPYYMQTAPVNFNQQPGPIYEDREGIVSEEAAQIY